MVFTQWSIHVVDSSDIYDIYKILKILFCVKWHRFIQKIQTLLRFECPSFWMSTPGIAPRVV